MFFSFYFPRQDIIPAVSKMVAVIIHVWPSIVIRKDANAILVINFSRMENPVLVKYAMLYLRDSFRMVPMILDDFTRWGSVW